MKKPQIILSKCVYPSRDCALCEQFYADPILPCGRPRSVPFAQCRIIYDH